MDYEIRKTFNGELAVNDTLTLQEGAEGKDWKIQGLLKMARDSKIGNSVFDGLSRVEMLGAGLAKCEINGKLTASDSFFYEDVLAGKLTLQSCEVSKSKISAKAEIEAPGTVDKRTIFTDCIFSGESVIYANSNTVFVRCTFSTNTLIRTVDNERGGVKALFIDCEGHEKALVYTKQHDSYY